MFSTQSGFEHCSLRTQLSLITHSVSGFGHGGHSGSEQLVGHPAQKVVAALNLTLLNVLTLL
jgi:hypothetical protein